MALVVYALDNNFNQTTIAIPFKNLQWHRRYYEAGWFEMQLPIKLYDKNWAYIGTAQRPELGQVQRVHKYDKETLIVSGFFCEELLNGNACYPRYIGDVSKTETAARNIFTRYYNGEVPIELAPANNPLLGDRTQSDFSDDELGNKLYSILESRELSYRVRYDYVGNKFMFEVWQGLDRTQSQNVNSFQTFSTEFGNLLNDDYDFDDSNYKNYAIIPCNANDQGVEQNTFYIDARKDGEPKREKVFDMRSSKPESGQSMAAFEAAVKQEVIEKMLSYQRIEDVSVDVLQEGYMKAYDLGDKCDVLLTDINQQMETRITAIDEVFKVEDHTVSVGLGNKRLDNMRKAAI